MRREAYITGKLGKVYLSSVFSGLRRAGGDAGLDNEAERRSRAVLEGVVFFHSVQCATVRFSHANP
jgi:hypothetical protein